METITLRVKTAREQKTIAEAVAVAASASLTAIFLSIDEAAAAGDFELVFSVKPKETKAGEPTREPTKLSDTEMSTLKQLGYTVYYAAERRAYIISWKDAVLTDYKQSIPASSNV